MKKITPENVRKFITKHKFGEIKGDKEAIITKILNAPSHEEAVKFLKKSKFRHGQVDLIRRLWGFRNKRVEHCFVCNKSVYFEESEPEMILSDAIYFETYGNWGSTVLDLEKHKVRIMICDDCFKSRKNRAYIEMKHTVEKIYDRISYNEYRKRQKKEYKNSQKLLKNARPGVHVEGYYI